MTKLDTSSENFLSPPVFTPKGPYIRGCLRQLSTAQASNTIFSTDFCGADTIAVGDSNGVTELFRYNGVSLGKIYSLSTKSSLGYPITSLQFRPGALEDISNILLNTSSNGDVIHWHVSSQSVLNTIHEDRQVLGCAYSPDSHRFATCGSTSCVNVYDEEKVKKIATLDHLGKHSEVTGHTFRVYSTKFFPNHNQLLASSGWDGSIQFWDLRLSNSSVLHISGTLVCADSMNIDSTGTQVVTGSFRKDKPLQVWSVNEAANLSNFESCGITSQLYSACWLDENLIACGGVNRASVYIVHYPDDVILGEALNYSDGIYCMAQSRKEKHICFSSGSQLNLFAYK